LYLCLLSEDINAEDVLDLFLPFDFDFELELLFESFLSVLVNIFGVY
jgi:hypothetical protein